MSLKSFQQLHGLITADNCSSEYRGGALFIGNTEPGESYLADVHGRMTFQNCWAKDSVKAVTRTNKPANTFAATRRFECAASMVPWGWDFDVMTKGRYPLFHPAKQVLYHGCGSVDVFHSLTSLERTTRVPQLASRWLQIPLL